MRWIGSDILQWILSMKMNMFLWIHLLVLLILQNSLDSSFNQFHRVCRRKIKGSRSYLLISIFTLSTLNISTCYIFFFIEFENKSSNILFNNFKSLSWYLLSRYQFRKARHPLFILRIKGTYFRIDFFLYDFIVKGIYLCLIIKLSGFKICS